MRAHAHTDAIGACSDELTDLVGKFLVAASTLARQIVDEFHLPVHEKQLQPLPPPMDASDPMQQQQPPAIDTEDMYVCNGILLRFASDPVRVARGRAAGGAHAPLTLLSRSGTS